MNLIRVARAVREYDKCWRDLRESVDRAPDLIFNRALRMEAIALAEVRRQFARATRDINPPDRAILLHPGNGAGKGELSWLRRMLKADGLYYGVGG